MSTGPAKGIRPERVSRLRDYLAGLQDPAVNGQELFARHRADLEAVTPLELMDLFNGQLLAGETPAQIFLYLDKVINAVGHALRRQPRLPLQPDSLLHLLSAENQALELRLGTIRTQLLAWTGELAAHQVDLAAAILALGECQHHYVKIQNLIFPLLEKRQDRFHGLGILWALQDYARQTVRQTADRLEQADWTEQAIRENLGKVFFALQGLVNKEQWILFPIAADLISATEWTYLLAQAAEYEPAFLPPAIYQAYFAGLAENSMATGSDRHSQELPEFPSASSFVPAGQAFLQTPTGNLNAEQAAQIFHALPVDLSFVDAENKVQYFTRPKDRIFPRSPAVIGRDVNRCHPPASVHVVEQIITEFREGRRDKARFWIDLQGRKILIEYFAVRDDRGGYLGVLEVSQDITDIQKLEGQQRLLDWE